MRLRRTIPAEVRAAVLADYEAGEKTDVIELHYGLKRGHARMIAARAGLPPRPIYSRRPNAVDQHVVPETQPQALR